MAGLCLSALLAGCSFNFEQVAEAGPPTLGDPDVVRQIDNIARELKFVAAPEVTEPSRANPVNSAPWLVCMRGRPGDDTEPRLYALLFNGTTLSSYRMAAVIDDCELRIFRTLPSERR